VSRRDPSKWDRKRGRHKRRASQEGQDWNNKYLSLAPIARPAPPPKPKRLPPPVAQPEWMDDETAAKLYALRQQVAR